MSSSLSHVYLSVGSLEATRRLFVDLLGLEVLLDARVEPAAPADPHELVIRVDDVDAMTRRLRAAGFVVTDPEDQEWGSRHAWFRDTDGRPISIYTPLDAPGG